MLRFDNVVFNDYQCRCELLRDERTGLFVHSSFLQLTGFSVSMSITNFSVAKTA